MVTRKLTIKRITDITTTVVYTDECQSRDLSTWKRGW